MTIKATGLWGHTDFLKLWAGQTVSVFGTQVTLLALSLAAVLTLNASAWEMGLLSAAERAPFLLAALFVGVWVDRLRRRPVMILADVGRALLLASIPAAAVFEVLSIEQLYVVGFLVGVLTVFFDTANMSYPPSLVRRTQLVEGNSKLEASSSIAMIAGPGAAVALVQVVAAPLAIFVDSVSYVASALVLWRIHREEPAPDAGTPGQNMWSQIGEGMRVVVGNPVLRSIAGCTATSNLFSNVLTVVFVLYVARDLRMTPVEIGLIFSAAGPGGLLGAAIAARAAARIGLGSAIVGSAAVGGLTAFVIPLAGTAPSLALPMLMGTEFVMACMFTIYNINQVSLRQAITPARLQGRMNASIRFLVWGAPAVGSLLGGLPGETIGLRATLVVGAVGMMPATGWVAFAPVRRLRAAPVEAEDEEEVAVGALS